MADIYIYKILETLVYKYNFINIQDIVSEIHPDHDINNLNLTKNNTNLMIENLFL